MSPALAAALADIQRIVGAGVRPCLAAIARHHKVCSGRLASAYGRPLRGGRLTAAEEAAHVAAAPHIEIMSGPSERPSRAELEDAVARWGINGAAEEYGTNRQRIRIWLARSAEEMR